MKIREYYRESLRCLCESAFLLGKGVMLTFRRLFTKYPNQTWALIMVCVVVLCYIQIGNARSERDRCNKDYIRLQTQLDSCLNKEVRYTQYK